MADDTDEYWRPPTPPLEPDAEPPLLDSPIRPDTPPIDDDMTGRAPLPAPNVNMDVDIATKPQSSSDEGLEHKGSVRPELYHEFVSAVNGSGHRDESPDLYMEGFDTTEDAFQPEGASTPPPELSSARTSASGPLSGAVAQLPSQVEVPRLSSKRASSLASELEQQPPAKKRSLIERMSSAKPEEAPALLASSEIPLLLRIGNRFSVNGSMDTTEPSFLEPMEEFVNEIEPPSLGSEGSEVSRQSVPLKASQTLTGPAIPRLSSLSVSSAKPVESETSHLHRSPFAEELNDIFALSVRILTDELKNSRSKCLVGWQIILSLNGKIPNLGLPRLMTTLGARVLYHKDERLRLPFPSFASLKDKVEGPHRLAVFVRSQLRDADGDCRDAQLVDVQCVDVLELLNVIHLARSAEIRKENERKEREHKRIEKERLQKDTEETARAQRGKTHAYRDTELLSTQTAATTQSVSIMERMARAYGHGVFQPPSNLSNQGIGLPRTNIVDRINVAAPPIFPGLQQLKPPSIAPPHPQCLPSMLFPLRSHGLVTLQGGSIGNRPFALPQPPLGSGSNPSSGESSHHSRSLLERMH